MRLRNFAGAVSAGFAVVVATPAAALSIDPFYAGSYTATSIGSVPDLPPQYGGLTFLDNDTIIIGGNANTASGLIYQVDVVRGAGNHITGFTGSASAFRGGTIGEYNDGGVVFGPGDVLFTSRWPVNFLGQTKPGSTDEDKIINLAGITASSNAAINFVPAGFPGAGSMKLVSWSGGQWYDASLAPDGSGTYDLVGVTLIDVDPVAPGVQSVPGGPEGFVYIAAGNPLFTSNALLIAEYSVGKIGAYDLDADGNPLANTRRDFITGLTGAEGAAIDPVTGDFLFSTFGGGNQIVVVQGFLAPEPPTPGLPEPGSLALLAAALGLLSYRLRKS
ncbi:MAG: hypothetical protein KJ025_11580 [Burkholderiales bacterium]|nr:hypothetical protein [Burkholderiales bacterium]